VHKVLYLLLTLEDLFIKHHLNFTWKHSAMLRLVHKDNSCKARPSECRGLKGHHRAQQVACSKTAPKEIPATAVKHAGQTRYLRDWTIW